MSTIYWRKKKRYLLGMGRTRKHPRDPYGEWLRFLRIQRRMTQDEVKADLKKYLKGWSEASSTLAGWEGKGNLPGREVILGLAEIYNVTLETLLGVERTSNGKFIRRDEGLKEMVQKVHEADKAKLDAYERYRLKIHEEREKRSLEINALKEEKFKKEIE